MAAMKAITHNLDREIWRDLMQRSGIFLNGYRPVRHGTGHWSTIIFRKSAEANILSTFEQLHQNKDEVFERG